LLLLIPVTTTPSTPDQLLLTYLIERSTCGNVLKYCTLNVEQENIVISCLNEICASSLAFNIKELAEILKSLINSQGLLIKLGEDEFDFISLTAKRPKMITTLTAKQIADYSELLDIARFSEFPTYITLLPMQWEWKMPIKCVLTSKKVLQHTNRTPLDFHGADISILYDKSDLEKQIAILIREFWRNNGNPTRINDLEYTTYLSDPTQKSLQKDPYKRYEYNADFEIQFIEGIGLIRICHCKSRRPNFQ